MKKILCIILVVVLCFFVGSSANLHKTAIAEVYSENLEYTINNGEVTITGVVYSAEYSNTDVVIPAEINGYPVTAIDDFAFYGVYELETIELPNTITKIGEGAFRDCTELCSIEIPQNLIVLGEGAFSGCSCLDSITLPEGITKIPSNCFKGCTSLYEIGIPESVESIEVDAFKDTYYTQYSGNWDEDVLYLSNHLIATKAEDDYYYEEIEPYSYTIKEGTKSISPSAFANSKWFSEIIMPNSVKYVGESAFDYCENLKNITLSSGLTEISTSMFGNCSSLTSITLPNNITSIKDNSFAGCTALESISIPNSVEIIGVNAFCGCTTLSQISLSNNIVSIGAEAFYNTAYYNNDNNWVYKNYDDSFYGYTEYDNKALYIQDYLIEVEDGNNWSDVFEIRSNTKLIADSAFGGYYDLQSVEIPDSVIYIGNSAFKNTSLTSVDIPNSVLTIGEEVFSNCGNIRNVVLPSGITKIPNYAFYNCSYLDDVDLPTSVKSIGEYAFYNSDLSSITIPEGATEICESAFENCYSLWSSYVSIPDSVTKIGRNAFANILDWDYEDVIYIGNHLINVYDLSDYGDYSDGEIIFEVQEGTLTIADGVFDNCDTLRGLIIPKSVKYIGDFIAQSASNLDVVCYMGSEEEWNNINIGNSNDQLLSSKINYNFKHYTSGDINDDTKVDLTDVVALAQYAANWNISCNELALDVNGDTAIDLLDVVHLAQYVANWSVELAPEIVLPKIENSDNSTTGKYDAFNNSNENNIYQNAPEGTVHVLMWRSYHKSEQLLIDQYQKLTGVKVKTTVTTEKEYPTKLVSMVSCGNSPDVIMFQSNYFPGLVTKSLQSLNAKYFQLDSDCWNKTYMDAYKINGVYFGVAQPKSWLCEYGNYVTYYSPQLLKNGGVTTMPYELYKQGKWNWDTQSDIIRKVKNKGFTGLALQSTDLFMLSAGVDFAKYDGSKYTNQLGSVKGTSLLTSAWMEVAGLNAEGCITGWDLNNVQQGKVGLFSAISYGLYNEGNWFQSDFAKNLEAVPVAGPKGSDSYTPVRPMCWGVPKKATNPEGAAYFLRFFLDTSNYDHSSTFYNEQFREVYNYITNSGAKKTVMHGWGVSDYVESGTYSKICNALVATTPSNITTQLNSKKGSVQIGIARANKDLARIKN